MTVRITVIAKSEDQIKTKKVDSTPHNLGSKLNPNNTEGIEFAKYSVGLNLLLVDLCASQQAEHMHIRLEFIK